MYAGREGVGGDDSEVEDDVAPPERGRARGDLFCGGVPGMGARILAGSVGIRRCP